jgi:hypothetical protein
MTIITNNPLNLPLLSQDELEQRRYTKGQLARYLLPPDLTFDYSLPQMWLDQFKGDEYYAIHIACVWIYPASDPIFGHALNLLNGNLYQ